MIKIFFLILTFILSACVQVPYAPVNETQTQETSSHPSETVIHTEKPEENACQCPPEPPKEEPAKKILKEPKSTNLNNLIPSDWRSVLPLLTQDDLTQTWRTWLMSCEVLKKKTFLYNDKRLSWQPACEEAGRLTELTQNNILSYFTKNFNLYQSKQDNGEELGLITGYYEPTLYGSRVQTERYRYPLYKRPQDMVNIDLNQLYPDLITQYPELKYKKLRARFSDDKLLPYYKREEIEAEYSPLAGQELIWVDDLLDIFFLQIQGSGFVQLENKEKIHIGYADQNGQAYQSIAQILISKGELTADKASMQGIKNWVKSKPNKMRELLNQNRSYVFFRELPPNLPGPLGALNVPLTSERSIAVDPKYIPLGAPIVLVTQQANGKELLQKLVFAQDTGGAIKGAVRADFFFGSSNLSAQKAGSMKQKGKIWVLLPKD